jgi:hypothetical protein
MVVIGQIDSIETGIDGGKRAIRERNTGRKKLLAMKLFLNFFVFTYEAN